MKPQLKDDSHRYNKRLFQDDDWVQSSVLILLIGFQAMQNQPDIIPNIVNVAQEGREIEIDLSFSSNIPLSQLVVTVYMSIHNQESPLTTIVPSGSNENNQEKFIPLLDKLRVFLKFDVRQRIRIVLTKKDSKAVFGESEVTTAAEIFMMKRKGVVKSLLNGKNKIGQVLYGCEEVKATQSITLHFKSKNVESDCAFLCFCPSQIYYRIMKRIQSNVKIVHEHKEPVQPFNNTFPQVATSLRKLCNQNPNQPFMIEFFNYKLETSIGEATITISQLEKGNKKFKIKGKKGEYKGQLEIIKYRKEHAYDYIDFMNNGMQFALVIGIDFTISNYHYTKPESLHYFEDRSKSFYERALEEVTRILLDYDYDKKVPVYGFGAEVNMEGFNSQGLTSNYFPLNGSFESPEVTGVQGVMNTYRSVMPFLKFSKPSLLAPIIRESIKIARKMKTQGPQYMVLLLLTDGDIADGDDVIDLIVECGRLPISIIIIGITNDEEESWEFMHLIDDNNQELQDRHGRKSERDMVKFVEYKKFAHSTATKLAESVLEELPRQVVEYHSLENIEPSHYRNFLPDYLKERQQQPHKLNANFSQMIAKRGQRNRRGLNEGQVYVNIQEDELPSHMELGSNVYLPDESRVKR